MFCIKLLTIPGNIPDPRQLIHIHTRTARASQCYNNSYQIADLNEGLELEKKRALNTLEVFFLPIPD